MFGLPSLLGSAAVLHEHVGMLTALALAGLGLFAGWLGAVVGIGGGVVIVPALVLAFGFDTKVAVSSSLVAVVATSAAAGSTYAASGQLNLRLALTLEMATTVGGLVGGIVAVLIAGSLLDGLFAVVMLVTAVLVYRGRDEDGAVRGAVRGGANEGANGGANEGANGGAKEGANGRTVVGQPASVSERVDVTVASRARSASAQIEPGDRTTLLALGNRVGWEERGHLGGAYRDQMLGTVVVYRAVRLWIGWAVSFGAGLLSGLLGVGGGFLKVPAMNLGMKVPIKVAAATSNFMIGVTAVASLFVYFARGYVLPFVAAPIAIGIAFGAYVGAKSSQRVSSRILARILAVVLVFVAVQMGLKAAGVAGV